MKHSTEWAICSGICFSSALAAIIFALVIGFGVGGFVILFLVLLGGYAALASNRFRKLEHRPIIGLAA